MINDLLVIVVFAAAVPANVFPILYTVWKNWWRHEVPRHMTLLIGGFALLIDLAIVRRVAGEPSWYDQACLVVYVLIAYQLYQRLWLLIKYNSPIGERKHREETRVDRIAESDKPLDQPREKEDFR